jgi:hypothetical protein
MEGMSGATEFRSQIGAGVNRTVMKSTNARTFGDKCREEG